MTIKKGQKKCKYCGRFFYLRGMPTHQAFCKKKKEFEETLSNEGIIADKKRGLIHISGGMKIYLMLGRQEKTEEEMIYKHNLEKIEKEYGIRINYDADNDKIIIREMKT